MGLRVAFFAGSYDHVIDGVTLSTNRQVAYLESQDIPVRVYAPSNGKPVLKAAGEFIRVPSFHIARTPYCFALGLVGKTLDNLEDFQPSLLHLATPDLLGLQALRWGKRKHLPVAATYHTQFARYLKHYRCGYLAPLCWRMLRSFYRQCDEVYVACESIAAELRDHGITSKITVNPFGVDTSKFTPTLRSMVWRRQHGIRDDEIVIAFVGRLVWEKGLDVIVRTSQILDAKFLPYRPLIVGEGPAKNTFRERMPNAVFTGRLGGTDLATAFASSDIFFFPSASETFGLVTVEALASGLPCVVADAAGSRDIVRNGVEGFVVPVDHADAFAEILKSLIRDAALRARMKALAIERAKTFSWESVLAKMLARFQICVAQ